jgi:hypothetical protein
MQLRLYRNDYHQVCSLSVQLSHWLERRLGIDVTSWPNMNNKMYPNTFIIGAPKCGTTSLARWLSGHPDVFMSNPKEPYYFCRPSLQIGGVHTREQYAAIFSRASDERIIAEATTATIYDEQALANVSDFAPDARIVVMVRNPLELAPSWHGENVRQLREDIADFAVAWAAMAERRAGRSVPKDCRDPMMLDYQRIASLGTQLERVYAMFPASQVYVGFLDDFVSDARFAWLRLLAFLNIADDGRTEFPTENIGYMPANLLAYRVIRKLTRAAKRALHVKAETGIVEKITWTLRQRVARSPITSGLSSEMHEVLDPEIARLERLTGRDLSHWRSA